MLAEMGNQLLFWTLSARNNSLDNHPNYYHRSLPQSVMLPFERVGWHSFFLPKRPYVDTTYLHNPYHHLCNSKS